MNDAFADLFRGEAGRDFWADTRERRMRTARRRDKRFCEIAEEEYQKAIAGGPPAIKAEESSASPSAERQARLHDSVVRHGTTLLLGAMGGAVLQSIRHHWKRLTLPPGVIRFRTPNTGQPERALGISAQLAQVASGQGGRCGVVVVRLGEFADTGCLAGGHSPDDVPDAAAVDWHQPT